MPATPGVVRAMIFITKFTNENAGWKTIGFEKLDVEKSRDGRRDRRSLNPRFIFKATTVPLHRMLLLQNILYARAKQCSKEYGVETRGRQWRTIPVCAMPAVCAAPIQG